MSHPSLSFDALVKMVRQVIQGQDLSKMTSKHVRNQIIQRLDPQIEYDPETFKSTFRNALNQVLREQQQPSVSPNQNHSSPQNEQKDSTSRKPRKRIHEDSEDSDDSDDSKNPTNDQKSQDSQSEFDAHDSSHEEIKISEARKIKTKSDKPITKRKTTKQAVKRSRSTNTKSQTYTEKQFAKLRQICRDLGQPVPPSRLRNKDTSEKCAAIVQFIASKGIDTPNPTLLTRKEIATHRERLEREKELEGIDTSNIIEGGRRSGRRQSALPPVDEDPLPSDLSGPELSSHSESDEEEYAASSPGSS